MAPFPFPQTDSDYTTGSNYTISNASTYTTRSNSHHTTFWAEPTQPQNIRSGNPHWLPFWHRFYPPALKAPAKIKPTRVSAQPLQPLLCRSM